MRLTLLCSSLVVGGLAVLTGCEARVTTTDSPPPAKIDIEVERRPGVDVDIDRKPGGGVDVDITRPGGVDVDINRKPGGGVDVDVNRVP